MSISCNSIFHYTSSLNNLQGILSDKSFKVNYCSERISVGDQSQVGSSCFKFAIPMVSFCDIPFTAVTEHTKKYGQYGIGLSKEWAKKNKLNPILYLEKNSKMTETLSSFDYLISKLNFDTTFSGCESDSLNYCFKRLTKNLESELGFIKNYSDDLRVKGRTIKDYVFYDEREWRYVPDSIDNKRLLLSNNEYTNNKDVFNEIASKERLYFEYEDISYIVLAINSQVSRFLNFIRKQTSSNVDLLCSKVITLEQISKDF